MKNVAFLGGVHGVGKTTFCKNVAKQIQYTHVTASQLIKEKKESAVWRDKAVADIPNNQRLLIAAIHERTAAGQSLLIDGHFTLITMSGEIEKITEDVFQSIGPKLIAVLCDQPETIHKRIKQRDGQARSVKEIERQQNQEKEHAERVAQFLKVPFIPLDNNEASVEVFIAELTKA